MGLQKEDKALIDALDMEKRILDEKISAILLFIQEHQNDVRHAQLVFLIQQQQYMSCYSEVLGRRIEDIQEHGI